MARNRIIKPDYWEDEKIINLSIPARLLFISIWNFADDEGIIRWIPELLKSRCFLLDDVDIISLMEELEKNELIFVYHVNASNGKIQKYGAVKNFKKHQKIDRPHKSKLPRPPSDICEKNNIETIEKTKTESIKTEKNISKKENTQIKKIKIEVHGLEQKTIDLFNKKLAGHKKIKHFKGWFLPPRAKEKFEIFSGSEQFSTVEKIEEYFEMVKESNFLTENTKFKLDLIWLLDLDNAFKVISGRYVNEDPYANPFREEESNEQQSGDLQHSFEDC